jgi:drug/metabolite transporter (DMT)-like permease
MNVNDVRRDAFLAGMLAAVAAWSVNRLITPGAHPDASSLPFAGVVVQLLACGALAIWFWRRAGSGARRTPVSA